MRPSISLRLLLEFAWVATLVVAFSVPRIVEFLPGYRIYPNRVALPIPKSGRPVSPFSGSKRKPQYTRLEELWQATALTHISHDPRTTPSKTPFEVFSADIDGRINISNQIPLSAAIRNSTESDGILPIYTSKELLRLSTSHASTHDDRQYFAKRFGETGGFVVIQFDPDDTVSVVETDGLDGATMTANISPVTTLQYLWPTLDDFFHIIDKHNLNGLLHHQSLPGPKRQSTNDDENDSGYQYVQFYLDPHSCQVLPNVIQETLSWNERLKTVLDPTQRQEVIYDWTVEMKGRLLLQTEATEVCQTTLVRPTINVSCPVDSCYHLMNEISMAATVASVAGSLNQDPTDIKIQLQSLLGADSIHSCATGSSTLRLAKYVEMNNAENESLSEGLTSHADWSFLTAIPVSPTPGLQVWNPSLSHEESVGQWIALEEVLRNRGNAHEQIASRFDDGSRFCILMAGKWLEIMTRQVIPACIHRVVTLNEVSFSQGEHSGGGGRLSAPFFFRPHATAAEMLRERYNNVDKDYGCDINQMNTDAAVEQMSSMFEEKTMNE